LKEGHPKLGVLRVEGDFAKPSLVQIASAEAKPGVPEGPPAVFKMKAISLSGVPRGDWEKPPLALQHEFGELEIARGSDKADAVKVGFGPMKQGGERGEPILGGPRVKWYEEGGLLVVIAPEVMLEGAESIVDAWRKKEEPKQAASKPAAK